MLSALKNCKQQQRLAAPTERSGAVVYGGGEVIKKWCKEHGAVYVTPIIIIKNKYKSIQRMAQNTALFKDNWDMGKAVPTLKDLLDKQVIDNRKKIEHG